MEGEYREGPVHVGLIVEAVYYPPEMINQGLLPVAVKPTGKYRQSFRQYEKNGDISLVLFISLLIEFIFLAFVIGIFFNIVLLLLLYPVDIVLLFFDLADVFFFASFIL